MTQLLLLLLCTAATSPEAAWVTDFERAVVNLQVFKEPIRPSNVVSQIEQLENAAYEKMLQSRTNRVFRTEAERLSKQARGLEINLLLQEPRASLGTGFFVSKGTNCYLVTALHVILDEFARANEMTQEQVRASLRRHQTRHLIPERLSRFVSRRFFIVPPYDETEIDTMDGRIMMNFDGASVLREDVDLAVLSLQLRDPARVQQRFLSRVRKDYSPIAFESMLDKPSGVSAHVYTIGYPAIGENKLIKEIVGHPWLPWFVSLPVTTFGRVAMAHPKLSYFLADLTISPGNSGGPVFEYGNLVGFVSAQKTIKAEDKATEVRWPLAVIQKAAPIKEAILELER